MLASKQKKIEICALYANYAASFIYPLILIPYISRIFGPEKWGVVAAVSAYSVFVAAIVDYAFHLSAQRDVSLISDSDKRRSLASGVFSAKVIIIFTLTIAYLISICFLRDKGDLYGFAFLIGGISSLNFIWYLRGIGLNILGSLLELFAKTLGLVLTYTIVKDGEDINKYFLIQVFCSICLLFASLLAIKNKNVMKISFVDGFDKLKSGLKTFSLHLSGTVGSVLPILILTKFATDVDVGIYSAAEKISRSASGLLDPFRQLLFPSMAKMIGHDEASASNELLAGFVRLLIFAMIVFGMLVLLSSDIVNVLFGKSFAGADSVLRVLSVLPVLVLIQNTFVVQWLLVKNKEWLLVSVQTASYLLVIIMFVLFGLSSSDKVIAMAFSFVAGELAISVISIFIFIVGRRDFK